MLRLAVTAKEFGQRPSSYLPELDGYTAFCLDEACAHALIVMREQARKEAEEEAACKAKGAKGKRPGGKGPVSLNQMSEIQEQLKQTGRYHM